MFHVLLWLQTILAKTRLHFVAIRRIWSRLTLFAAILVCLLPWKRHLNTCTYNRRNNTTLSWSCTYLITLHCQPFTVILADCWTALGVLIYHGIRAINDFTGVTLYVFLVYFSNEVYPWGTLYVFLVYFSNEVYSHSVDTPFSTRRNRVNKTSSKYRDISGRWSWNRWHRSLWQHNGAHAKPWQPSTWRNETNAPSSGGKRMHA